MPSAERRGGCDHQQRGRRRRADLAQRQAVASYGQLDDGGAQLGQAQRHGDDGEVSAQRPIGRQLVGDHDDRPVDQVHAVADPPEPAQRAEAGHRRNGSGRHHGADDEERRAERGEGEQALAQRRRPRRGQRPQRERGDQAGEAERRGEAPVDEQTSSPRGVDEDGRDDDAHHQLAGAGVGAVVHAVDPHRPPQRGGRGRKEERRRGCASGRQADRAHRPGRAPGDHHRDHGDDDVELLLDRQAPEVQHRRWPGEQLGVRHPGGEEVPVGHVERGGGDVTARRTRQRVGQQAGHRQHGEHRQRGRQQPAGASPPEAAEVEATGRVDLGEHERADQHAGQGEEQRHREEPAADRADAEVEQHDGADRQAAEAVEARLVGDRRSGAVGAGHHESLEGRRFFEPSVGAHPRVGRPPGGTFNPPVRSNTRMRHRRHARARG